MMNMMLVGAVNIYLFKDYFSNAAALSIVGLIQTVTDICSDSISKPLVTKFGKKEIASVGMLLAVVAYLVLYFLPNLGTTGFLVGTADWYVWICVSSTLVVWAFVTDVIDYHELFNWFTGRWNRLLNLFFCS